MSFLVRLPLELYERNAFDAFVPGSFSIGTARAAMWLAQLSYEDENAKQDSILKQWGVKRIASFNRPFVSALPMPSTAGFVARNDSAVFIAFEGTDPLLLANWVTDFRFLPNKLGIHQGFGEALDAVWSDIIAALEQSKPISAPAHHGTQPRGCSGGTVRQPHRQRTRGDGGGYLRVRDAARRHARLCLRIQCAIG